MIAFFGVAIIASRCDCTWKGRRPIWVNRDRPIQRPCRPMSALTPIADIRGRGWNVRYVPKANIARLARNERSRQLRRPLGNGFACRGLLLALNSVSAEGRVLLADLERILISSTFVPSHERVHAG